MFLVPQASDLKRLEAALKSPLMISESGSVCLLFEVPQASSASNAGFLSLDSECLDPSGCVLDLQRSQTAQVCHLAPFRRT